MARTTCPTICSQLTGFLRESYQDSRRDSLSSPRGPSPIRIDDRLSSDVSPDFCRLSVLVNEKGERQLTLHLENPPLDADVGDLIYDKGGHITGERPDLHVEVPLLIKEVSFLREFARAIRRIVGRGRTYPNPNWKWVCRRTANSLDRLADRLMEFRRLRAHTPSRGFPSSSFADAPDPPASESSSGCSRAGTTVQPSQDDDEENIFRILGME